MSELQIYRGKRAELVVINGELFATPYRKNTDWYCANCDKKLIVPVKSMSEICECGAIINWLKFICS